MSDRKQLSFDEAVAMLPDGESIHTEITPMPGVLIGADWDRIQVIESLKKFKPELAGPIRNGNGTRLVLP